MALLSDEEIAERLAEAPGWEHEGGALVREWKFADFAEALRFVNRVGEEAESANHHPDILLHGWNRVRLTLSTHSAGGLTDNDFSLARTLSGLA